MNGMEAISSIRQSFAAASDAAPVLSRIDPPHPIGSDLPQGVGEGRGEGVGPSVEVETGNDLPAVAGRSPEHLPEQIHSQALQLGSYLRAKQQELDRREALMNAREAKLENELRIARLWVRERDELDREREASFSVRQRALDEQAAAVAAAEFSAEHDAAARQAECQMREERALVREANLREQELRLAAQLTAIEEARERLEQQRVEQATERLAAEQKLAMRVAEAERLAQLQLANLERARVAIEAREQELEQRAEELAGRRDREAWESRLTARQNELEQAERLLAAHARDLDDGRAALVAEREKIQREARDERRALAQWQQRERADISERRQQLDASEEALARHREAVEKLRADAAKMHREGLEMRLVSEQLWLELARQAPAAELTRSLATIRQRLADHYRDATQRLAAQQAELVRLGERLDQQQQRLVEQREQLQTWLAAQQHDIECQAARLVAREQELHAEATAAGQRETAWHKERNEFRREIRELLARLRRQEAGAISAG
jgi:hypothetical protein